MWLLVVLNMLFGSTFTLGKLALEYANPFLLIAFRMIVAGAGMLAYQYFFNREYWFFKREHLWLLAQYIFFAIYLSYICEFWSLQYVSSAKASMIFSLTPFITALIAYFFISERLTKMQVLGLVIGLVGSIPIIMGSEAGEMVAGGIGFLSFPELVLIMAVAAASYGWVVMQKLVTDHSYSTVMLNGVAMLVGGIFTFGTSLLVEGTPHLKVEGGLPSFLLYAGLLIVIANLICFNLYGVLLRKYSATFISFTGFTQPIFASFFGWLLLSEGITWNFVVSLVIITVGLYLFYKDELKVSAIV